MLQTSPQILKYLQDTTQRLTTKQSKMGGHEKTY